jgi:hypothetical protein
MLATGEPQQSGVGAGDRNYGSVTARGSVGRVPTNAQEPPFHTPVSPTVPTREDQRSVPHLGRLWAVSADETMLNNEARRPPTTSITAGQPRSQGCDQEVCLVSQKMSSIYENPALAGRADLRDG